MKLADLFEAKGFAIYVDGKVYSSPWMENEEGAKKALAAAQKKFSDKKVEMKPITVKDTGEKPTHRGNPVYLD